MKQGLHRGLLVVKQGLHQGLLAVKQGLQPKLPPAKHGVQPKLFPAKHGVPQPNQPTHTQQIFQYLHIHIFQTKPHSDSEQTSARANRWRAGAENIVGYVRTLLEFLNAPRFRSTSPGLMNVFSRSKPQTERSVALQRWNH